MTREEALKNPKIRTMAHLQTLLCAFIEEFTKHCVADYMVLDKHERMELIHDFVDGNIDDALAAVLLLDENDI